MNRFRTDDGAAAVEMGLLLPLLVMLAFGIIEFSTAYNRSQGMAAAVREGGRFAATAERPISDIEDRVWATLQSDAGGSGFRDKGDLQVRMSSDGSSTVESCSGEADTIEVEAWVNGDHYDLTFILWPSVPLEFRSTATFPCLD